MRHREVGSGTKRLLLAGWAGALMGSAAFIPAVAQVAPLPNCAGLAAQLLANSNITAATSAVQPAADGHLSYCRVTITVSDLSGPRDGYLPGQKQAIGILIGLPLSAADGGSLGSQGNWNGSIRDQGGGGYAGVAESGGPIAPLIDSGYASSSTDTGHTTPGGGFALNPDGTLNWGLIRDFAFNGIHAQSLWTKKLVQMYYGKKHKYAYWTGCSTGGRQGHQQAQKYPKEYDGILAGDSAFNWDRFIPAELWPQVVMNEEVGGPIAAAKLNAVTKAAITACDGLDGIKDGVLQDPRACRYSAKAFVCRGSPNDPANCLTAAEAKAVDKIWDGVVENGKRLWFGLERGTPLETGPYGISLAGPVPFPIATDHFRYWINQDPSFDWHTLTEASFIQAFKQSQRKFNDVIGTDDPDLSDFRNHGAKMITYNGLEDELIFPRGTFNYYDRVTERMGGFDRVQRFYRFFLYPGNNHCAFNMTQPNAPLINVEDLFKSLRGWVEDGVAPDSLVAYNNLNPALATVSRPICKYPDKLVYDGTGSTNVAANFRCKHREHDPLAETIRLTSDGNAKGEDDDDGDNRGRGR